MKLEQAARQALEALSKCYPSDEYNAVIDALREALADTRSSIRSSIRSNSEYSEQAEQEPVAFMNAERNTITWNELYPNMTPLYTAPVRTKDLTDDEIQKWIDVLMYDPPEWALKRFARAVIAADREKNK